MKHPFLTKIGNCLQDIEEPNLVKEKILTELHRTALPEEIRELFENYKTLYFKVSQYSQSKEEDEKILSEYLLQALSVRALYLDLQFEYALLYRREMGPEQLVFSVNPKEEWMVLETKDFSNFDATFREWLNPLLEVTSGKLNLERINSTLKEMQLDTVQEPSFINEAACKDQARFSFFFGGVPIFPKGISDTEKSEDSFNQLIEKFSQFSTEQKEKLAPHVKALISSIVFQGGFPCQTLYDLLGKTSINGKMYTPMEANCSRIFVNEANQLVLTMYATCDRFRSEGTDSFDVVSGKLDRKQRITVVFNVQWDTDEQPEFSVSSLEHELLFRKDKKATFENTEEDQWDLLFSPDAFAHPHRLPEEKKDYARSMKDNIFKFAGFFSEENFQRMMSGETSPVTVIQMSMQFRTFERALADLKEALNGKKAKQNQKAPLTELEKTLCLTEAEFAFLQTMLNAMRQGVSNRKIAEMIRDFFKPVWQKISNTKNEAEKARYLGLLMSVYILGCDDLMQSESALRSSPESKTPETKSTWAPLLGGVSSWLWSSEEKPFEKLYAVMAVVLHEPQKFLKETREDLLNAMNKQSFANFPEELSEKMEELLLRGNAAAISKLCEKVPSLFVTYVNSLAFEKQLELLTQRPCTNLEERFGTHFLARFMMELFNREKSSNVSEKIQETLRNHRGLLMGTSFETKYLDLVLNLEAKDVTQKLNEINSSPETAVKIGKQEEDDDTKISSALKV